MRESKAAAVNFAEKRMIILVELRVALCGHTGMPHDHVHTVRNVDFHLPSGNWALVNPQTVVEIVGDARRVRAAHLTLSGERVQDFVLRVGAEALLKVH